MSFTVEYRDLLANERVLLETDNVFDATVARDQAQEFTHLELVNTNLAADYRDILLQV